MYNVNVKLNNKEEQMFLNVLMGHFVKPIDVTRFKLIKSGKNWLRAAASIWASLKLSVKSGWRTGCSKKSLRNWQLQVGLCWRDLSNWIAILEVQ